MKIEDRKYWLKKLLHDKLTDDERATLLASEPVERQMKQQWEEAAAGMTDKQREEAIWEKVCKALDGRVSGRRETFYKIYSWVASLLLLLGMEGTAYWALTRQEAVSMYVVSSGLQSMQSVSLPDGTEVQMGPGSRLTYPADFTGKVREVKLAGQAFFDVAKLPGKPFVVQTGEMQVEAVGTAFELFSYDTESRVETILLNGKIKVGIRDGESGQESLYWVSPDERLQLDRQTGEVSKQVVNADKYTAWRKQRMLSFENEKLSMIIPRLEQWYGRKVMCQKDLAERYRFTFKVRGESLEQILKLIQLSSPLKYEEVEDGNYSLSR